MALSAGEELVLHDLACGGSLVDRLTETGAEFLFGVPTHAIDLLATTRISGQDDPDVEAPPGEIGEIGGRGASLMLGYSDDQAAIEAAFNAPGWFMTGDLGWLDDAGYLHITGRKKARQHEDGCRPGCANQGGRGGRKPPSVHPMC